MNKVTVVGLKGVRQDVHNVYDFAKDGGVDDTPMGLFGLKAGTIVHNAWYEVETAVESAGAATVEAGITGGDTDGIFVQKGKADLPINKISGDVDKGAHLFTPGDADDYSIKHKVTADTDIDMLIGTADLTAGKIHFYLEISAGY